MTIRSVVRSVFIAVTLVFLWAAPARGGDEASIGVLKHLPGDQAVDLVIRAGDRALQRGSLLVTYRPGSMVERTRRLPVPAMGVGENRTITWTPTDPGIVRLDFEARPEGGETEVKAVKASQMVGVLFPSTPVSGLLVMFLAAVILFGGCVWAFRLLSADQVSERNPDKKA